MISIMFHSAGLNNLAWRSSHISDPLDIIKDKLEVIHEEGYKTIFMREAAENSGKKRDNIVHLTFDDGYLDNWVHIFPLLKKYNLKATIFVTAEFVDPGNNIRKQKWIYEREHNSDECCAGFLSFSEMREMERSGLIEIQSHSLTHTWYFKGPEIVDFWHPGAGTGFAGPVWMLWNRFPLQKPFYHLKARELEKEIPYGTPIYEHGKSLETIKYYPEEKELEERLINLAKTKDNDFYHKKDWKKEFKTIVNNYRKDNGTIGSFETGANQIERIKHELSESKQIIENRLGHKINGLCWPGGGVTKDALKIAKETGYKYFILPSKWKNAKDNTIFSEMIPRISNLPKVRLKGKDLGYPSKSDFKYYLRSRNGYSTAKWLFNYNRLKKLLS